MKCKKCGNEVKAGSLFCPNCGKEIQIVPDYNAYEEEEYLQQLMSEENQKQKTAALPQIKKKNNWLLIILTIAVALVLVVFLIVFLAMRKKEEQANSFDYQYQQGIEAQINGDIQQAISYYENALLLEPSNTEIRLILLAIYLERKDYTSAIIMSHEILQLDTSNERACKNLVEIYEKNKDYDAILALKAKVAPSLEHLFSAYMVSMPSFSMEPGTLTTFSKVELMSEDGHEIYYSLDGSDPILRGERYSEPIALEENYKTYTIKAVCMNEKGLYSEVLSGEYKIDIPAPSKPIVTPDGGEFEEATTIEIKVPSGCSAYYTWDGTDPNAYCEKYTEPLEIPEGNNILSVMIIDNTTLLFSDIYRGNFIYYSSDEDEGQTDE